MKKSAKPPKTPKSRAESKEETRAALIRSAVTLFSKQGFDTPSLDDICDHAGFTRGAFYVHFKDRDDLVRAAMQVVGREFLDSLLGTLGDGRNLADVAARFVTSMQGGTYPLGKGGAMRPHQLLDACARSPAVRAQYVQLVEESIARVASIARDAQSVGAARDDVPADDLGLLLVCAVIGAHTLVDLDVKLDLPRATMSLMQLAAKG